MKKSKIQGALFILIVTSLMTCQPSSTTAKDNIEKTAQKIKVGALVVDVRTEAEFSSGHYKNAKNIPVDQIQDRLNEFGDKSKPIVVYCAAGVRAGTAKKRLEKHGFTDVTNAGGLRDLPN